MVTDFDCLKRQDECREKVLKEIGNVKSAIIGRKFFVTLVLAFAIPIGGLLVGTIKMAYDAQGSVTTLDIVQKVEKKATSDALEEYHKHIDKRFDSIERMLADMQKTKEGSK